jgi:hypothetical protein
MMRSVQSIHRCSKSDRTQVVRYISCIAPMTSGIFLSGCSIHPLPENVTELNTYQIIQQIRCEAREGVIDSVLTYMASPENATDRSRELAKHYREHPDQIRALSPRHLQGQMQAVTNFFWNTGIAYNYELVMTEMNNLNGGINLLDPFSRGSLALGLKGNFDRQRQNTRTFTITDRFGDLIQKVDPQDCDGRVRGPNYVYPITGKIGIEGMIHAFVYMTLFGNLGKSKDAPKGPPTLVDALEFTTTIGGSAAPKITFTPMGSGLQVADASLTGEVSRKDVHKVIVALAIDEVAFGQIASVRSLEFGQLLAARVNSHGVQNAVAAADQYLTQRLFSPTIIVRP